MKIQLGRMKVAVGFTAIATAMLLTPGTASASDCGNHDCQDGVYQYYDPYPTSDPGDADKCESGQRVRVCVTYDGDYVWVLDKEADGRSAIGAVLSFKGIPWRLCKNRAGAHTWVKCNFDWVESYHSVYSATYKSGEDNPPFISVSTFLGSTPTQLRELARRSVMNLSE